MASTASAPAQPGLTGIGNPRRRLMWKLQRTAQGLLRDKRQATDRNGEEVERYTYRVAMCKRGTHGFAPEVRRSPDGENARFAGLVTCGSVWHCPVCAAAVANKRRDAMQQAMKAQADRQGAVYLANFTFQHTAEEGGSGALADQLAKLRKVLSRFKGTRAVRSLMEGAGAVGGIRALEVTFGEINGWHPHVHELLFADRDRLRELRRLRKLWAQALIKNDMAGLRSGDTSLERFRKLRHLLSRCCVIQDGTYAADYVAKFGHEAGEGWGMSDELTKGHTKIPRRARHTTPWGLLMDFAQGDKRAGWLWREYAEAFHNARQLYWSPKLRQVLGVSDDATDEEAADDSSDCNEKVIQLTHEEWRLILSRDCRWEVLYYAAIGGEKGVRNFLASLTHRAATHGDDYIDTGQDFIPARYG